MTSVDAQKRGLFFQGKSDSRATSAATHQRHDVGNAQNLQAISFATLSAEGDLLLKQGEFDRAIHTYNRAMEFKANDRIILISRSKCYNALGKCEQAMKDANRAMDQDKTFFRAILQKADVHFATGDFEVALVYYHRGAKVRPDLEDFRLGIQRARKAIEDAIGGCPIDSSQISTLEPATHAAVASIRDNDSIAASPKSIVGAGGMVPLSHSLGKETQSKQPSERGTVDTFRTNRSTASRKALGKLHSDKEYLQQLISDPKISKKDPGLSAIAEGGLRYLDKREDFWRQQNGDDLFKAIPPIRQSVDPMSDASRRYDHSARRQKKQSSVEHDPKALSAPITVHSSITNLPAISSAQPHPKSAGQHLITQQNDHQMSDLETSSPQKTGKSRTSKSLAANASPKPEELIVQYIEQSHECFMTMQHISKAMRNNDPETSLRFALDFLNRLQTTEMPDKPQLVCNTHHSIGAAYASLGKPSYAAAHFRKELEVALDYHFNDSITRSLTHLGRIFLRLGDYSQALDILKIKIDRGSENEVPETYISMGRCYFEAEDTTQGLKYANMCFQWLDQKAAKSGLSETEILRLRFDCCGLAGSCLTSQGKNRDALQKFELQIQHARKLQDTQAEADALSLMATCYTKLGDTEKSTNLQQMAVSLRSKKDKRSKPRAGQQRVVSTTVPDTNKES
eukprot:TRINITY_DN5587_c0_g1_i1.p1 TRINITY_DN5587_c0_g1~~TRINITY_DN5587_c0_g1_i1.p1  ORF type:complete len:683 (+),score=132.26 TRINITY_DN5587_c0_g1_i1:96-2144(+)